MSELISTKDREIVRTLAKKCAEIANSDNMREREKLWYLHNELKGERPMITIETWTFGGDIMRPNVCETNFGRSLEGTFNDWLMHYEDVCDDVVMPNHYSVFQGGYFKPFNLDSERITAKEGLGFHVIPKINDLEEDFHVFQKSLISVDPNVKQNTLEYKERVESVIGDIMQVKVKSGGPGASLTNMILTFMSMETLMISLYDYPELVHKMMDMLTSDIIEYMQLMESNDLYVPNNDSIGVGQGTYGFTNRLKSTGENGKTLIKDMWGYMDSQETSEISPDMFKEFFFPYYKRIGDMFGLLNYGCCEPVNSIWDNCLSQFTNLRKVSVSPWCDEEFLGDRLRNSNTIFHRKPSPLYMGVDEVFNEEGFKAHVTKTLKAAKGCKLEFSYRDVYSLKGERDRPKRVVNIVKNLVDKYWS